MLLLLGERCSKETASKGTGRVREKVRPEIGKKFDS